MTVQDLTTITQQIWKPGIFNQQFAEPMIVLHLLVYTDDLFLMN